MPRKLKTKPEHNPRLPILITLLTIFSGLWVGTLSLIWKFIEIKQDSEAELYNIIIFFLSIFSFFVLQYVLRIVKSLFYETCFVYMEQEIKLEELRKRQSNFYDEAVSGWIYLVFGSFLVLFVIGFAQALGWMTGTVVAILVFLIVVFVYQRGLNSLRKNKSDVVRSTENKPKKLSRTAKYSGMALGLISGPMLVLYLLVLIVFAADVDITLDKSQYSLNDTVLVEVAPRGIVVPKIELVTYSNEHITIYNGTNEPFKSSKRYLIINSSILTPRAYNSHIGVIYSYFENPLPIIGKKVIDYKFKSVPVYDISVESKKNSVPEND